MTLYAVALFLHVVGALGLFMALGLEWTSLWHLRRATTTAQARLWTQLFASLRWIYPPSAATLLLTGFYMTATAWGGVAWIGIALAAMVLLFARGAVLTGGRMAPIRREAAPADGLVLPDLRQRLQDPLLWTSIQIRIAIDLGIVFLMTVKPDLGGALLTIGIAIALGLASTVPAWIRDRAQNRAA
jgi:hypothetical protein